MITACGAQDIITSRYEKWVQESMKRGQKIALPVAIQLGLVVRSNGCSFSAEVLL